MRRPPGRSPALPGAGRRRSAVCPAPSATEVRPRRPWGNLVLVQGTVRFILDGRVRSVSEHRPDHDGAAVVARVRAALRHQGRLRRGRLRRVHGRRWASSRAGRCGYRAVNACILFLPALDGKALLTVESLGRRTAALHPVQQAMVECHGSQCGFCTPGFVMSLYALYETRARAAHAGGGSTTCWPATCAAAPATGRSSTRRAQAYPAEPATAAARCAALSGGAARHRREARSTSRTAGSGSSRRASLDALPDARWSASRTRGSSPAPPMSGLWVTKQHRESRVAGLARRGRRSCAPSHAAADPPRDRRRRDATPTRSPVLAADHPDLGELHPPHRLAPDPQSRHPRRQRRQRLADRRHAAGAAGARRERSCCAAAASSAHRHARRLLPRATARPCCGRASSSSGSTSRTARPGRLVRRVQALQAVRPGHRRRSAARFAVELEGGRVRSARVAYGGMAATPVRAGSAEAALTRPALDRGRPSRRPRPRSEAEFAPISDMRASAAYRRLAARNLLRKFWIETAGAPGRTRVLAAEGSA